MTSGIICRSITILYSPVSQKSCGNLWLWTIFCYTLNPGKQMRKWLKFWTLLVKSNIEKKKILLLFWTFSNEYLISQKALREISNFILMCSFILAIKINPKTKSFLGFEMSPILLDLMGWICKISRILLFLLWFTWIWIWNYKTQQIISCYFTKFCENVMIYHVMICSMF